MIDDTLDDIWKKARQELKAIFKPISDTSARMKQCFDII